jgi:hypothetical protein
MIPMPIAKYERNFRRNALDSKSSHYSLVQSTAIITVNKEKHIVILRRLRDAVSRECPERLRTNSWVLLQKNAPAHQSVLVKDFLANNHVTTLEFPTAWLQLIFTCSLD